MKAVIMAGGEGSRLRPMTCNKPKPMIDFFGKPVMEHIIELLKKHNITEIAVTLQYMPQTIMNYFGDGTRWGVHLEYFTEISPLGTAGSVKNAEDFLGDEFLVISGDAVTDIDLTEAIIFHHSKNSEATLILSKVESPLEYGIVVTNEDGKIERFMEKPDWSEVFANTANTGIYILKKRVLDIFEKDVMTDFSGDVFPKLLQSGAEMYGLISGGYWCDIGDTDAYIKANRDRLKYYVSPSAVVMSGAQIFGPVWIGDNVKIAPNVTIMPYSVIGENARIGEHASVKGAIVGARGTLKNNASLRGCVVGSNVNIGEYASVFEGAVLGDNSTIGKFTEVLTEAKVWAGKQIGDSMVVSGNIVFGSNHSHTLFGERAIDGEVNVDITPEFAAKLGASFAAVVSSQLSVASCKVGVGYGSTPALLMLKNAFIAGAISIGVDVVDLNPTTLPITRNATVFYGLSGGVYFEEHGGRVYAHILDDKGLDILPKNERQLEQLFSRNDFLRVEPSDIGKITKITDYNTFYIHQVKGNSPIEISLYSDEEVALNVAETVMSNMGAKIGANWEVEFDIDCAGEVVDIYDETGKEMAEYQKLYLIIDILAQSEMKVALPLNSPMVLRQHAISKGLEVINSKVGDADILRTLHTHKLQYQYGLMFDGIFLISQVCQYLYNNNIKLADYVAKIPHAYVASKEVSVPQDRKGDVIREIWSTEEDADLTQGVRIARGKRWVMVVPHKTRDVVNVMAEGENAEVAEELCIEYANKIKC